MKFAPLPRSKAKTAFGLLGEVRKIILAEPKRYNQGDSISVRRPRNDGGDESEYWPACGTIGCVGGWVYALKYPGRVRFMQRTSRYPIKNPLDAAQEVLGLTDAQASTLFYSSAAGALDWEQGRKNHARRGAAHIARFQKKYAKQLKGTSV